MISTRIHLVSGAASGIGRHMARALGREGHSLMLTDIDADGLRTLLEEEGWERSPRIATRVLDVRDAAGWDSLVAETIERFGALDVMLNIAGYLRPGWVHDLPVEEIDKHMDINAKGVMYATQAGSRVMRAAGGGHIVNIASIAGISSVPGLAMYTASKHAVRGFSLAVALELAEDGVKVSVVCPDAVETPMLELQVDREEAAMTFGGGRGLSLDEIEVALREVLRERPLEKVVPIPGSGRAAAAKLGNAFPGLTKIARRVVVAQGRRAQARRSRV